MKKGTATITTSILTTLSICIITLIIIFCINIISVFITYQKVEKIATKYMFVIERFGYLTSYEKNNLKKEIENSSNNIKEIEIVAPSKKITYGEYIEFKIKYKNAINIPFLNQIKSKIISLVVTKYVIAKN